MNYWNVSPTFAVSLSCHYPFYLIFSPSFHSIVQSLNCVWLCNPMDCSISVFPVLNYFSELAQTHVHWVDDAIQPSHPLSSPSPPALVFPDIRVFFTSSGQSIGASASAAVLPMSIQGWFPLGLTCVISLQSKGLSRTFILLITFDMLRIYCITRSQLVTPFTQSPLAYRLERKGISLLC